MKVTFLGTGTSQGVPVIACDCSVCTSTDVKDNRLRTSVMIEVDDQTIIIDTGPDFRQQMLRENVKKVDAILYTHEHKDHVAGLDDIRAYNFIEGGKEMDIYATEQVQKALKKAFHYIFAATKYPGVPQVHLNTISSNTPFYIGKTKIIPIEVKHYRLPVLGFRIHDFTYITDAKSIADEELKKVMGSKVLVLNALRKSDHISHFSLKDALEIIEKIRPEKAYLTHISHLLGMHEEVAVELPPNVFLAYDGLKFTM